MTEKPARSVPALPGAAALSSGAVSRRNLLRASGAGAAVLGGGSLLEACSSGIKGNTGGTTTSKTINIGFIHPLTGSLADFASGDEWVLQQIRATTPYKSGFKIGGTTYKINIIDKDTQSSSARASQLATQLIQQDNVDMICVTSTPETVTPVSLVCEQAKVPCNATNIPWQSWYGGLGGNPAKPTKKFTYNTLFFFGLEDLVACFMAMWKRVSTDKTVGFMYPNDSDGNAFRAVIPPIAQHAGYKTVVSQPYTDGSTDYSTMISTFKSNKVELFTNVPLPPDFNAMWKQSAEQGFKPKLATVAKVLLFPTDTTALGSLVNNVATDSFWGPWLPYASSFTQQTCQAFANAYEADTGNQWVQTIGGTYSLFEVAYEAFKGVNNPHDKLEVANALHAVSYSGMNGPINFTKGPAPGVRTAPVVGVQWKKGTKYPWTMQVVDNTTMPAVHTTADLSHTNP
jgi:branched-chain amino acid transport system substrate-binding protein